MSEITNRVIIVRTSRRERESDLLFNILPISEEWKQTHRVYIASNGEFMNNSIVEFDFHVKTNLPSFHSRNSSEKSVQQILLLVIKAAGYDLIVTSLDLCLSETIKFARREFEKSSATSFYEFLSSTVYDRL